MEQLQGMDREARNDRPHPKHICEALARYKDVLMSELFQESLPKRKVDHKIEVIAGSEPPCKAPYRSNQKELPKLKKQFIDFLMLLTKVYCRWQ
jgi:hypothetical protein